MFYFLFPALYLYFGWRLVRGIRRRWDVRADISWLTFLTACVVLWLIFALFPSISRQAAAVCLLLALLAVIGLNLYLFRRYDRWRREQEEQA